MDFEWFGLKTTWTVFTGLASKPVATIFTSLASKPMAADSIGLASKPAMTVFSSLASKLVATVSPCLPQNWWSVSWLSLKTKVVEGFPVWASKSPRRFLGLRLKTKWASVYRLCHKTDRGRSARDTR
jgi:hypothetical protein